MTAERTKPEDERERFETWFEQNYERLGMGHAEHGDTAWDGWQAAKHDTALQALAEAAGKWQPITDDGDVLRLAVKLQLDLEHNNPMDNGYYVRAFRCGIEMVRDAVSAIEEFEDEKQRAVATRRVIVKAAAEIGKQCTPSSGREGS